MSNSMCADSISSDLSLAHSAHLRSQFGGQNTSEEDIVCMEAQLVAVADESFHPATRTSKENHDLIAQTRSLALSPPKVQTIPATPSKLDDMSSIGSDEDITPKCLGAPSERISL